jgi:hypothetical protein
MIENFEANLLFEARHMDAVRSIAREIFFNEDYQPWLRPATIERAIELAIANVYEVSRSEIVVSRSIH